ncbi:DMT family transporter [Endozoicomonas sp. 4G]|uniref:DMT family transporter n=1 Tax=Endozoicomonas sp. 4G TaxID=2872754 RepID=UPI002078718F|nr:DMT family transporter [Endozoicomonas sp. 4G]
MNIFLYVTTVLIWGSTWVAIYFQLGDVPVNVSVFYRFALAGILFLPTLIFLRKLQTTRIQDHKLMLLQGCCLFSLNFICFYNSTIYISSGLSAVVFSLATIFNAINNKIFYKEEVPAKVMIAAFLGSSGLLILFLPELYNEEISIDTIKGIIFAILGTYLFSLGNMLSKKTTSLGLSPITTNAYGMFYGAIILFIILLVMKQPLVFSSEPEYIASLMYLSIFGSIVAFTTYLSLVARIGANNAAYSTVMFPVIALFLSSIFEGYEWHLASIMGIALTVLGNLVLHMNKSTFLRAKPESTA